MSTEKEIIAKAKSDYFITKGKYANPYPMGSTEFNHYERGWMQSLKLNDGKLVEPYKPPPLPPHRPPAENRYAEMKGRSAPLKKSPGTKR